MNQKIKVAFIYHKSNVFLSGKHFDNTYYHFFMKALQRNNQIEIHHFPTDDEFNALILKNNFDIILLWANTEFGMPSKIHGIQDLDIPVVARAGDPHNAPKAIKFHKEWKIDYYFHFMAESYFHELYKPTFKYKTIIFGLEPSLYNIIKPFNDRIKNKILNTGAAGNNKILNKLILNLKDRSVGNPYIGYKLRTMCNKLPYVDYTPSLQHEYVNDKFPKLLEKYSAAIAATTDTPNTKFWEIPAAGCLTFMEITEKNKGEYLGYIDNETAIFINEDNYKEKFKEFLDDPKNPKWEKIAKAGRTYTLENLNNDKAVENLVKIMESLV